MGDPSGVGPELSLRVCMSPRVLASCVPIIFGNVSILNRVSQTLALPVPPVIQPHGDQIGFEQPPTSAAVLDLTPKGFDPDRVQPSIFSKFTGRASYEFVDRAIQFAMANHVDAIATGPIHKEALNSAGVPFPGHTEMLEEKTGADRICMMLTSEEITCSVVTAHVGLAEVATLLSTERILEAIELSYDALQRMRGRNVRLVVCGLNPHAGENGLFGNREEERLIVPAIEAARSKGINVLGPLPPDTAFMPANRAKTDGYICMYHDQGLIPLKALAFDKAVNVTLGLPIVRTSVDHGTALDIAWQGKASVTSFEEAVDLAVKLASTQVGNQASG